jgi:chromosome segregation ATPase
MPGDDQAAADAAELRRLRRRVDQQEHALARLTEALFALRRGGQALREENRELRLQIEVARRLRHGTAGIHDIAS